MNASKDLKPKDVDPTLAKLYARAALDCVVDVAVGVAHDFVRRTNEYRDAKKISSTLRSFRYRVGFAEDWPAAKDRKAIYEPLFGGAGGRASDESPFQTFGQAVRDASSKRSDRVSSAGDDMLRARFVDAANDFLSYLETLIGAVSENAEVTTAQEFDEAVKVLMDEKVAAAFSLEPATHIWPPKGAADGNAGALIEKITRELELPIVTQQQFAVLHRIALHGSLTIDGVLRKDHQSEDPKVVDQLTINASNWESALTALTKIDVAWETRQRP